MNIAVLGCKNIKDETCIGCQRCLTALHLGTCVMHHCEHRDGLVESVRRKAGVPLVAGTHDYVPDAVFAS